MEKQKERRRERSLFRRMLIFLLTLLLLQAMLYLAVFSGGGILDETEDNAFSILRERTANRKLYLENEMVQRWSNVKEDKSDLLDMVDRVLKEEGKSISDLASDQTLSQEILARSGKRLVSMLRRNGVTGVFAILNSPSPREEYPGVYLRDYDPVHYAEDNADLLLVRGLPQVARQLSVPMDSYWSAFFRFGTGNKSPSAFFYYPMEAASSASAEERKNDYFYYWSGRFSHSPADRPVVSYTTPLVWEDGTVIGVIGVDVTVDYLSSHLKYSELGGEQSGAYFLGYSRDGGATYHMVCVNGPMFQAYFGQDRILETRPGGREGIVLLPGADGGEKLYGAVQPIKLYNSNTPFEEDHWALIGIQSQSYLLHFSERVHIMLQVTAVTALAMGLIIVYFAARFFTDPISELVDDLRRSDPNQPIRLRRIRITELDTLSESIENLSNAAAESAARISKIISMSHIPIGVFEHHKRGGLVFCSRSLFEVLGWEEQPEEDTFLDEEEFLHRFYTVTSHRSVNKEGELVYRLTPDGQERWVQLFCREEDGKTLGAFLDVTADVESKQKLEYERDYDVLTGLYNRRAFDYTVESMFESLTPQELKTAVIVMLDLDNLKYINDSAGHDYGDRYIQSLGYCLQYFRAFRAVVGRRSGDEFNVFLYGYANENEVRTILAGFWEQLGRATSSLPGGGQIRIRASGGLAWYGKDADSYAELMRLADFAMYNVKHTVKGVLREFDRRDYNQKSILISGQDALNRMLENRMVRYALQPIVSSVDGSVFGYEFLMRPMVPQLTNLDNLFRLARSESKLAQLEELTWVEAMNRFSYLVRAGQLPSGTRAFINSVSNQYPSDQVLTELEKLYPDTLSRVVLEITEGEEPDRDLSRTKKARMRVWGGLLALDDYGTGYNTEAVLVDITPDIVKVDVSLVHRIDRDSNRLALVRNLMAYAKVRGIKVLAEGVETLMEMETLISCGVDYLQGYYISRPQLEVPEVSAAVVEDIRLLHERYFA